MQSWSKSIDFAQQLAMPYEQGLSHCEIGQHLPLSDPSRLEHLNQAIAIFKKFDAAYHLAKAQAAAALPG